MIIKLFKQIKKKKEEKQQAKWDREYKARKREYYLDAVRTDWDRLKYADLIYKDDSEIVLESVRHCGKSLQFASDRLRGEREIVLEALKADGLSVEYAADELKNDRDVAMTAVENDGGALMYLPDEFKGDKEIVLAAVRNDGYALQYVSDQLRNDKKVVTEAMKSNGYAFRFVPDDLKNDPDVLTSRNMPFPEGTAPKECYDRIKKYDFPDEGYIERALEKAGVDTCEYRCIGKYADIDPNDPYQTIRGYYYRFIKLYDDKMLEIDWPDMDCRVFRYPPEYLDNRFDAPYYKTKYTSDPVEEKRAKEIFEKVSRI